LSFDDDTETSLHVPTRASFACAVSQEGIAKTNRLAITMLPALTVLGNLMGTSVENGFHFPFFVTSLTANAVSSMLPVSLSAP
jgi:hypothetical protein